MKILIPLLLLSLGVNANETVDDLLSTREWTSSDGKPLKAELISADKKIIELKRSSDRRVFKIPLNKISEDDQKLLKRVKNNLLKSTISLDRTYYPGYDTSKQVQRAEQVAVALSPSSWELARRLGVLVQLGQNLSGIANPYRHGQAINLDSIVLGADIGKIGSSGGNSFLFKSGKIYVRLIGAGLSQKGQAIMQGKKTIASVGSPLNVSFPTGRSGVRFVKFTKEKIGLSEAVVLTVTVVS